MYERSGNVTTAEDFFNKAVQNCKDIRGAASNGCSEISRNAGEFYYRQQQFEQASHHLREAHNSMSTIYESGHEELKKVEGLLEMIDENLQ